MPREHRSGPPGNKGWNRLALVKSPSKHQNYKGRSLNIVGQQVPSPTPLNPTPVTCHKREQKLHSNFWKVALQKLHRNIRFFCNADVIFLKSCAATDEKLHCNIDKAGLRESGAFLPLRCGFQALTFRLPQQEALTLWEHRRKNAPLWDDYPSSSLRDETWTQNCLFSNLSGAPGISGQIFGISRQKSLISLVSKDIPNFLAPTPSRGRPHTPPENIRTQKFGFVLFFRAWF